MRFVGVDPGLTGGLALLNHDATRVKTWPMPVTIIKTGGRTRKEVNPYALMKLVEDILLSFDDNSIITIEQVSASPQMGTVSAFNFGAAYAMVKAAFAFHTMTNEHLVRVEGAIPSVWKRHMRLHAGVTITETKTLSRKKAQEMWPRSHQEFIQSKDDGRAEAALLAEYGRLLWLQREGGRAIQ